MAGGHVCLFTLDGRPLIGKGSFEMVETITPLSDEWAGTNELCGAVA